MSTPAPAERHVVELSAADLPASCPPRHAPVWNQHPRVALDLDHTGEARCPYCGTLYRLKPGTPRPGL